MLKDTLNKGISTPIAISIILILVILVSGFTWWQYGEMWRESSDLPEIELPGKEAGNETADWEIFRNKIYGYEIKYPRDWVLSKEKTLISDEWEEEIISLNSPENEKLWEEIMAGKVYGEGYMEDIIISYYSSISVESENKRNKLGATTLDELIERSIHITSLAQITFAGEKAYEVIWGGFGAYYSILIERDGHLYIIQFGNRGEKSELTETDKQIISTFKFIEATGESSKEVKETPKEKAVDWAEITPNLEFKEYFEEIMKANAGLEGIKKFTKETTKPIKSSEVKYPYPPKSKDEPEWVFSPDETKAVSIFAYFGEPDSSLDIYNWRNDGKVERLRGCGTPCSYWIVFWLNDEQFIFVQRVNNEYIYSPTGKSGPYVLNIVLYDLAENTEISYTSQEVEEYPTRPSWPEWDEKYYKKVCVKLFGEEHCKITPK